MSPATVVIGGGLVGKCIALSMQRSGHPALLIDAGALTSASWGNAGHFATEHVEPLASPEAVRTFFKKLFVFGGPLDFVWQDVTTWLPWALRFLRYCSKSRFAAGKAATELLAREAIDAWRRLLGARFEELIQVDGHWAVEEMRRQRHAGGRTRIGAAEAVPLTTDETDFLNALLGGTKIAGGQRFFGTGQMHDHTVFLDALNEDLMAAGGTVMEGWVEKIIPGPSGHRIILAGGQSLNAETVIVANGVWAKSLLEPLGFNVPLIAERGYHIEFEIENWPEAASPLVLTDRFIVTGKFGSRLRATSYVEFGRPASPPDQAKWQRLERNLRDVGILKSQTVSRWMGSRPTLPDYVPAIGGNEIAGIFYAIGHGHLGLTLAAITGELVRDLVDGKQPVIETAPYSLERFGSVRTSSGSQRSIAPSRKQTTSPETSS